MLRNLASLVLVSAAACGADVSTPGQSGDEASGSGAAAVASSGAGAASSSAVGSATTGAGGGPTACGGEYVEVTDLQTTTKLASGCAGSWGAMWTSAPFGFYVNGGPAPGVHNLDVEGCATADSGSQGLRLVADKADAPSTYPGSVLYRDAQAQEWADMGGSAKITFDNIGAVGDVIEGSYVATVYHGAGVMDLKGSFRVCHVEDENVP